MRWHTGRLPKEEDLNEWGEVLVTTEEGFVQIAEFTGSEFKINKEYVSATYVIAWARMPEPYRKEGK